MAETLYVRCPICSEEFRSGIEMDRRSFESATVAGNEQECPACGAPVLLSKDTLFFRDA